MCATRAKENQARFDSRFCDGQRLQQARVEPGLALSRKEVGGVCFKGFLEIGFGSNCVFAEGRIQAGQREGLSPDFD